METVKLFLCTLAGISIISATASAQPPVAAPMLINYQGELRSPGIGAPVADGRYDMLFRMYDVESAGTPLWEGRYSKLNDNPVEVSNGIFSVLLGSGNGNKLDSRIFDKSDLWLEIKVGSETLEPRQRIASVAYSISDYGRYRVAGNLYEGGETLTEKYVNSRGPDSMTGSSGDPILEVTNTGDGYAMHGTSTSSHGIRGTSEADRGRGVYGVATGAESYGVYGLTAAVYGAGVAGENPSPVGRGVYGLASFMGPVENYGGFFEAKGDFGYGVQGVADGVGGVGVCGSGRQAGVQCNGDLVVTGAYRGEIGPNNGAPFPRPAYDSGWVEVPDPNRCITLNHDLGGDPDNYVVDMQFRGDIWHGIHQRHYGGNWVGPNLPDEKGLFWRNLDSNSITVCRLMSETMTTHFRLRIWVYN